MAGRNTGADMWLHLAGYWVPGYLKEPRNVFFGGEGLSAECSDVRTALPLTVGFSTQQRNLVSSVLRLSVLSGMLNQACRLDSMLAAVHPTLG